MARRKVRVGFCGVGSMGQMAHLKNYAVEETCEVVAISEPRGNTARAVAKRYGIPHVYPDAAAMLKQEKLDAIVASQPFARHGVLVPRLLKAGVPVMTEKPLASSFAVGQKIVRAVRSSGTFVMLGYHKRSDPATMFAKREIGKLVESGELGEMTYVRMLMPAGDWIAGGFEGMVREPDGQPTLEWDPPARDMDEKTFGQYTSFVNYYIHQVNLVRHLLGEPYKAVFADRAGVLLVGESASGVTCTIEMSPFNTSIDWQEHALVCFERGWVKMSLPAPLATKRPGVVEIYRDSCKRGETPTYSRPTLPHVDAMRQQATNFIDAVRGKIPPLTTAEEALEDLRVARDYIRLWKGK